MATVKELKATARPKSGKGAARAERRAGRVPNSRKIPSFPCHFAPLGLKARHVRSPRTPGGLL